MALDLPVATRADRHDLLDSASISREQLVWPGMCGHNSLFVGQIGDWTWDAVSRLCGTDVLNARNAAGEPTYLSFYYFRVRGSARFHVRTPTFGDRLLVTTNLYDFGSEAVLALHRIARAAAGRPNGHASTASPFTADEFYRGAGEHLYVETFNRWISRPEGRSNRDLVRSSPLDFHHGHLPALPDRHSPRSACHRARTHLTFREGTHWVAAGPPVEATYRIDITRDLNGVGLLYFASYFSIVDWALLQWWRGAGRSDSSFLERVAVDQQLCYLGNADADCTVAAVVQPWDDAGKDSDEVFDVVLRDRENERLLAVCTLRLAGRPPSADAPRATAG